MKSAIANTSTPNERIKLRTFPLCHGLSEIMSATKITSATGKTIAKKVSVTLSSNLGSIGLIRMAVQIELTPSATIAESIISSFEDEVPCRKSRGTAINING